MRVEYGAFFAHYEVYLVKFHACRTPLFPWNGPPVRDKFWSKNLIFQPWSKIGRVFHHLVKGGMDQVGNGLYDLESSHVQCIEVALLNGHTGSISFLRTRRGGMWSELGTRVLESHIPKARSFFTEALYSIDVKRVL
jgi:hypothetical protein